MILSDLIISFVEVKAEARLQQLKIGRQENIDIKGQIIFLINLSMKVRSEERQ